MRFYRHGGALIAVVVIASAALFMFTRASDEKTSTASTGADLTTQSESDPAEAARTLPAVILDPTNQPEGEVLLEPIGSRITHSFSPSVSTDAEAAPVVALPTVALPTVTPAPPGPTTAPPEGLVALTRVEGHQPGLYGATRDVASCNKMELIDVLETNSERGAAWAAAQGIDPADIREFIATLTPLVLTRDTRVTSHGFLDGQATPHQSVLQAGRSVLVDELGLPSAQCSSGNPLASPKPTTLPEVYVGPKWPSFNSSETVVVIAGAPVDTAFIVVDLTNGGVLERPIGFGPSAVDTPVKPSPRQSTPSRAAGSW